MIKINSIKVVTEFVDSETGEIFTDERVLGEETKKEKKPRSSSKKIKDDGPIPKVTLLDNKLQFNKAAIDLTGFEPEQKIDVKFEKVGRVTTPILCEDSKSGNRLAKAYTVSFRGSRHDSLIEYGDVFELVPYPGKEGYFKLIGNVEKEDDIVDVPEEISAPDDDDFMGEDTDFSDDFDLDLN